MVPSPNLRHQLAVGNLLEVLYNRVANEGLGWLDVILSDEVVLQPCIVVMLKGERPDHR